MKWINYGMKLKKMKEIKTNSIMKTFNGLAILLIALLIISCNNTTKNTKTVSLDTDTADVDTTVYGKCGDGTAMHTLELITDKGDTVVYSLESADTCADVQGGLFVGDRLAVIGYKGTDDMMFAKKVINITSLLGKWVSIDRTFEIQEGGAVASDVKEPKPYTDWKILNGKLILSSDTFDVYSLGVDSLYLENNNGIYGYKRFTAEKTSER